jgi:hypothetical protein
MPTHNDIDRFIGTTVYSVRNTPVVDPGVRPTTATASTEAIATDILLAVGAISSPLTQMNTSWELRTALNHLKLFCDNHPKDITEDQYEAALDFLKVRADMLS